MNYLGIDVHKHESQVAVLDDDGEIDREIRVENANLDEIAEEYAGRKSSDRSDQQLLHDLRYS